MIENKQVGGFGAVLMMLLSLSVQDSCVLCDGAEGWEDRGGGRAEAGLHGGGQLPVDEPRTAGAFPARSDAMRTAALLDLDQVLF